MEHVYGIEHRPGTAVGAGRTTATLRRHFFFQAEDGIRDYKVTGVQTWCSSDLIPALSYSSCKGYPAFTFVSWETPASGYSTLVVPSAAIAAASNALLAPELAARHRAREEREGRIGVRSGQVAHPSKAGAPERAGHLRHPGAARPRHHRRAARLCVAPLRGGGAPRWAPFGRIHAAGDGRRTAREHAGPNIRLRRPDDPTPSTADSWPSRRIHPMS